MGKHDLDRSTRVWPGAGANTIPAPDQLAHEDGLLMHDVTVLNTDLGRYVLRYLDADSGRAAPLDVAAELALADRMTEIADQLRARANRRQSDGEMAGSR